MFYAVSTVKELMDTFTKQGTHFLLSNDERGHHYMLKYSCMCCPLIYF